MKRPKMPMKMTPVGYLVQPPVQSWVKSKLVQSILASWSIFHLAEAFSSILKSWVFLLLWIPSIFVVTEYPRWLGLFYNLALQLCKVHYSDTFCLLTFIHRPTCRVLLQLCIGITSDTLCICYQMWTLNVSLLRKYRRGPRLMHFGSAFTTL